MKWGKKARMSGVRARVGGKGWCTTGMEVMMVWIFEPREVENDVGRGHGKREMEKES